MAISFIKDFWAGITRDEKSPAVGVCSNIEEFDIFDNKDYIVPTQTMSADTLPASTEAYSYTAGNDDTVYAYGKETAANKVRILSVATGGASNPGSFSTLFTSADATNLAYKISPLQYHQTTETPANYLYYITKASTTIILKRYNISGASEATVGTLTGLDGTNDRLSIRAIYGELFIMNGRYVAKVDDAGTFTEKAFTLPVGWEAVDICEAGDMAVILCRSIVANTNACKGFFWDLSSSTDFDDTFDIPFGGPQWIQKHAETIKICCAANGQVKFYQLSGAFAGAVPQQLQGMVLTSVSTEADQAPISAPNGVSTKDHILYFTLSKTDKSAIYAIGQIDQNKQNALILAKRFATTSYATHVPYGLLIQGPNFYAAFSDNGTASMSRCESLNSPARSSNAVYETVVLDDKNPLSLKEVPVVSVLTKPLAASTSVTAYIATDYGDYTSLTRADGTVMNTTSATVGTFKASAAGVKVYKIKITCVSSGTSAPYITTIAWVSHSQTTPSFK